MKKILLLGATGTAGCAIAKRILSETDYHVTLFARHAEDMFSDSPRATVVNGDAENIEDLKKAMLGQDVVYCAISGEMLPKIAKNIVTCMEIYSIKRLIFMGAVGIYNEIPDEIDGKDNLDNEPAQLPNRQAVDIVEESNLNYTVIRPGYLKEGSEDDFVLSIKGEAAKGYITTIPSLVKLAVKLISNENLYARESISITKDARKR